MSKNRSKSGLVHKKGNETFDVSREKATGKLFIKGTDIEVASNKVCNKGNNPAGKHSGYNFNNPSQAQDLGDEWSDYAWSADDF